MRPASSEPPSVFITGASSGIGKACALALDREGFRVIAGVRKQADADALRSQASERLRTVIIDVADSASVSAAAVEAAALCGGSLFGLVNNAGTAFGGPLEIFSAEDIRRLIDVNVIGVLTVTKALLPLLRRGRGRIINMGSTSGIVALPCLSVYGASKFALKGMSDALRLELRPAGVSVSLLEIGNVETPIWDKGIAFSESSMAAAEPAVRKLYAPLVDLSRNIALKSPRISAGSVARAVIKALRSPKPKPCYTVGLDAWLFKLLACLPRKLQVRLILIFLPRYGTDESSW